MFEYYTFSRFLQFARIFLDIAILSFIIYYAIKIVRNNSRTTQIFKGIIMVLFIHGVSSLLGLKSVFSITEIFVTWGFLAIIIIFQPEIRVLLERVGKTSIFSRFSTLSGNEKGNLVNELVAATMELSQKKIGALITIEQKQSLSDYIKTGKVLNSIVTRELLTTIFVTSTPLHDGAVIIQGDKIACASAYFPPTELELPTKFGARHRAAIGISEVTDSITIVVSEESGVISIAEGGKLNVYTPEELYDYLIKTVSQEEIEIDTFLQDEEIKSDKFENAYHKEETDVKDPIKIRDIFKKKETHKTFFKKRVKDQEVDNKIEAKTMIIPEEDTEEDMTLSSVEQRGEDHEQE